MFADYTPVAQQASDPYHARYYPAVFAELEQALSEEGDLSKETLDGIYTNARLAITFDLSEDDYSAKGNTRFYGLRICRRVLSIPRSKRAIR